MQPLIIATPLSYLAQTKLRTKARFVFFLGARKFILVRRNDYFSNNFTCENSSALKFRCHRRFTWFAGIHPTTAQSTCKHFVPITSSSILQSIRQKQRVAFTPTTASRKDARIRLRPFMVWKNGVQSMVFFDQFEIDIFFQWGTVSPPFFGSHIGPRKTSMGALFKRALLKKRDGQPWLDLHITVRVFSINCLLFRLRIFDDDLVFTSKRHCYTKTLEICTLGTYERLITFCNFVNFRTARYGAFDVVAPPNITGKFKTWRYPFLWANMEPSHQERRNQATTRSCQAYFFCW